ncbi:MAG: Tol-Pal system protein TolB, partial [Dongiaceae bacterium]
MANYCYRFRSAFYAGLLALGFCFPALAEIRIDITRGQVEPLPIAVADFFSKGDRNSKLGSNISEVIAADLERSGLFKALDQNAFIQSPEALLTQPRFADWRQINAQALVSGAVDMQPDGRLRVEFR